MTTKERLHELVDELSEQEADATLEFIVSRRECDQDEPSPAQDGLDFLISVADGDSGLDLESLRTVRDRAWR